MWKKEDGQPGQPTADAPRPQTSQATRTGGSRATIGPSISIRGDVTGSEDLLIQGKVDGSINLDLHAVAVGSEGRVKADITGRLITVEGHVEGDLTAQEQIVLLGSARVQGDIKAPRVVLEDGATFRGLVDMSSAATAKAAKDGTAVADGDATNGTPKQKEEGVSAKAAEVGGKGTTTPVRPAGRKETGTPRALDQAKT